MARKRGLPFACRLVVLLASAALGGEPAHAQFRGVLTWHNDNARTGQNLSETRLTPANVTPVQFGKLCSYPVDGMVDAQPLYLPQVNVPGQGIHNVAYIATEYDSVYAFDADCRASEPLWHVSFVDTVGVYSDGQFGITGTPVISMETQTLYAVAKTIETDPVTGSLEYVLRLHALDVRTGKERPGSPTRIRPRYPGSGVGNDGHGHVIFNSFRQIQRAGLLLLDGVVYIAWAGHRDVNPYHGWLLGYDARTLEQVAVYNDTPNGARGGIWQSGGAPAADSDGNIFFQTGNGTFDAARGGTDFGDSLIRLPSRRSPELAVADYFTPYNQAYLSNQDLDLASGGVLLLPHQPGPHPLETVSAGKEGKIFVVDRTNMGKFDPDNNDQIVETVLGSIGGYFSSPAYWQGRIYYAGVGDLLNLYPVSDGLLSTYPVSSSTTIFPYPGTTCSISANGSTNGIVWAVENAAGPAVLHAYDAIDLSHELYNSNQSGTRDLPGPATTFSVPTIANGKVYIGTTTDFDVYGLR